MKVYKRMIFVVGLILSSLFLYYFLDDKYQSYTIIHEVPIYHKVGDAIHFASVKAGTECDISDILEYSKMEVYRKIKCPSISLEGYISSIDGLLANQNSLQEGWDYFFILKK